MRLTDVMLEHTCISSSSDNVKSTISWSNIELEGSADDVPKEDVPVRSRRAWEAAIKDAMLTWLACPDF